jgi:hypothetical protein
MDNQSRNNCIAFAASKLVASGAVADVAAAAKELLESAPGTPILFFDADTSAPVEIDLRGTVADVCSRLGAPEVEAAPMPRSPGRPRLGVVAREVTLLPRHWEWLASQPGGASVTLRKLVEVARKDTSGQVRRREVQEAAYRFSLAMAGDETGFEEAMRALYAGDRVRFETMTDSWPCDVRTHARRLAAEAFVSEGE